MRKIAIALSKGGVGKTTTAINLAAGLAKSGARVLLIDTDTQGQTARGLGLAPVSGLADVVSGNIPPLEAATEARPNLHIIAGGEALAGVKHEISRRDVGASFVLTEAMSSAETHFDFILIDTAPGWDALAVNVLVYADEVLTPVSLSSMSIFGLVDFTNQLERIRRYHRCAQHRYVLPTFMDRRAKEPGVILEQLRGYYPQRICDPIRYNIRLAEAPGHGKSIFESAPKPKGSQDYQALVARILKNES